MKTAMPPQSSLLYMSKPKLKRDTDMSLQRPQRFAAIAMGAMSAASLLHVDLAYSADKPAKRAPVADVGFLEYLGTLESEEENWTDIANADAVTSNTAPANAQPAKQATKSTSAKPVTEAVTNVTESK
jgi:hypothetical protein